MTTTKSLILVCTLCLSMVNCKQNVVKNEVQEGVESTVVSSSEYLGEYVSESYSERDKGFDWVAVSVKESTGDSLQIVVHSRDDLKKPTCTFEAECKRKNDSTYVATVENKNILFTFSEKTITVSTEKPEDSDYLHFFCNGGATLAGSYTKTDNE